MAADSVSEKAGRDDSISGAAFDSINIDQIAQSSNKGSAHLVLQFLFADTIDENSPMSASVIFKNAITV